MAESGFRYLIEPRVAAPEIFLVPYWRLRGTLFWAGTEGVAHRFVDATLPAAEAPEFPASLGIRPQAMTLRFVAPDSRGRFLLPSVPAERAAAILAERFADPAAEGAGPAAREFIGESLGVIYAPFYLRGKLFDAVLGRALPRAPREAFESGLAFEERPPAGVRFIPALCPGCGWELAGERDALALRCERCPALWYAGRRSLEPLDTAVLDDGVDASLHLPFWRLAADRVGTPFDCWTPAFKIRPELYLRLAAKLTRAAPRGTREGELPRGETHPVTLPLAEAEESVRWVLSSLRGVPPPREPAAGGRAAAAALAYVPFHRRASELENPVHGLVVERNALRLGREL